MDESEAKAATGKLLAELREAQETREDADRRIAGLRKLVEGYIELFPLLDEMLVTGDLDDNDDGFGPPRGMDAALTVLRENAGKWYQVQPIVNMLDKRDWMPRSSNPRNAVRAALERLVENGKIEKAKAKDSGAVIYRHRPLPKSPSKASAYDEFGKEPF